MPDQAAAKRLVWPRPMGSKVLSAALAVAVTLVLAAGASGAAGEDGVTDDRILLGGTAPLSGAAAAFSSVARGAEAYFKHVNARGGVNGRTIEYRYRDDAYNPAQTIQIVRELVEQDKVFAIFNTLGTEQNQPVREYLNQRGVPHVFVASGATTFGRDYEVYPWTIGYQPSYIAEGYIYGRWLARDKPGSKIAILFQNDDYGRDLIAGLKRGLGRKGAIVAQEAYEVTAPDVQSQISKLRESGAKVLMLFATPKFAIQAFVISNRLKWRPLIVNNVVSSASNIMELAAEGGTNKSIEGSVSIVFLKDPVDPKWRNDAAIKLYRQVMARYAKGANIRDVYHVYGMAVAHSLVTALKKAGRNLTRAGLMRAVRTLSDPTNPFLLPKISVKTGGADQFPIEQAQLQRWTKGRWVPFGGLWGYRAG
jgi:branched-chain amino acid transport system substrate-binding protein